MFCLWMLSQKWHKDHYGECAIGKTTDSCELAEQRMTARLDMSGTGMVGGLGKAGVGRTQW